MLGRTAVEGARPLSDRQRLALTLEGCALLSHLEWGGWRLRDAWQGWGVDPAGRLAGVGVEIGASRASVSMLMIELLEHLFGPEVLGPGEARGAARRLLERWRHELLPFSADEHLSEVLAAAPFLGGSRFRPHLESIFGSHRVAGRWRRRTAGLDRETPRFGAVGVEETQQCRGTAAFEVREGESEEPDRGVMRWRDFRGAAGLGAGELVRAGRFEAALGALKSVGGAPSSELLRLECLCRLGRWRSAAGRAAEVEVLELPPEGRVILAHWALLAMLHLGRWRTVEKWAASLAATETTGSSSTAMAAWAQWELGESFSPRVHRSTVAEPADTSLGTSCVLERMVGRVSELRLGLDWLLLRPSRTKSGVFERGLFWRGAGRARLASSELEAAERSFEQACRCFRKCDGPSYLSYGLTGLAEARLRLGRVAGVARVAEALERHARGSGDLEGELIAASLMARLHLTVGDAERAVEVGRRALASRPGMGRYRATWELRVLVARGLGWMGQEAAAADQLSGLNGEPKGVLEPEEEPFVWALARDCVRVEQRPEDRRQEKRWLEVLRDGAHSAEERVHRLDGFRRARLVSDLCRLERARGLSWGLRSDAAATLRRVGAVFHARIVEGSLQGPWAAVRRFLEVTTVGEEEISRLFREAGYPEASLELEAADREVRVLVAGEGGDAELSTELPGGRLVLRCSRAGEDLRCLLLLALQRLEATVAPSSPADRGSLVGESPSFEAALDRLERLAPCGLPVLILGETGTGKELAAHHVHRLSKRRGGPLLAVNCAALSDTLILSDLFGHARGAFTGADRERAGVFESAKGGTVFLDEIGDLPLAAQGSLLRVLQEGEVRRLGESRPRAVDISVVAATHHDLEQMVDAGRFRQDLYYRLRVAAVTLPPLRMRGEDILALARHFLNDCGEGQRLGSGACARLLSHPWRGNVRELKSVLQVASALCPAQGEIDEGHLDLPTPSTSRHSSYHLAVDSERRRVVSEALERSGGSRAEAARQLGISPQAVSYLVRRLDLS